MKGYHSKEDRVWAADTGCYSAKGSREFVWEKYAAWLTSIPPPMRERCLFATAPDVVGDAEATLERSRHYLPKIRDLGYAVALIAQDGIESTSIPWSDFDCIFIGGTTEFKLSQPAFDVMHEARRRGKWVHVGRVNSFKRLRLVKQHGAHSVDGTHVVYGGEKYIAEIDRWLDRLVFDQSRCSCPNVWEEHDAAVAA